MTEETIDFELEEQESGGLLNMARKILLAGIGAVALAQDEIEEFINKLVERGEIAEQDGRKLVNEIMERRKKIQQKTGDEFSKTVNKQVEQILQRMDVPSKADIDSLSKKISELSKKIDELTEEEE